VLCEMLFFDFLIFKAEVAASVGVEGCDYRWVSA
jgi:hypothetical protein